LGFLQDKKNTICFAELEDLTRSSTRDITTTILRLREPDLISDSSRALLRVFQSDMKNILNAAFVQKIIEALAAHGKTFDDKGWWFFFKRTHELVQASGVSPVVKPLEKYLFENIQARH